MKKNKTIVSDREETREGRNFFCKNGKARGKGAASRLLAGALALCLAFGPAAAPAEDYSFKPGLGGFTAWAEEKTEKENSWYPEKEHGHTDYADMAFTGYDKSRMDQLLAEMVAAGEAEEDSSQQVKELYQQIQDEVAEMETQFALVQIRYYSDVTDQEMAAAMDEMTNLEIEIIDGCYLALQQVLEGPWGSALREELTQEQAEELAEYRAVTDREKELVSQETKLSQQYNELMMAAYETEYNGEIWTEERLDQEYPESDEDYWNIKIALLKQKNEKAGSLFKELVAVRNEMAKEAGYDHYAAYMYEDSYNRDFTPEDVQQIYGPVKEYLVPLYQEMLEAYYSDMGSTEEADKRAAEDSTGERILDDIEPYMEKVDPALEEAFAYMREYHLYDIAQDDKKMSMGFTIELPSYGDVFIFNQPYGYAQDYSTMIHEFGHFNALFYNAEPYLWGKATLDVAEIHSQGLEVLFFEYMDDIFGEEGEVLQFRTILNMLYAISEGCKYDEFQQTVYANPDMSLEEINALSAKLEQEYGAFYGVENEELSRYSWVEIPHTFQSPMYYIGYATSAMSALDIWAESLSDRDGAVEKYMRLSAMGLSVPYRQALKESGLRDMLEAENIEELSREIQEETEKLTGSENTGAGEQASEESPARTEDGSQAETQAETKAEGADSDSSGGSNAVTSIVAVLSVLLIMAAAAFLFKPKKAKGEGEASPRDDQSAGEEDHTGEEEQDKQEDQQGNENK